MKIQNIVAGLLLVAVSQVSYAVDNRIYNSSTMDPVKFTVIYKNGKKESRELKQVNVAPGGQMKKRSGSEVLIITTKANPIKKILFSLIGNNQQWMVSLDSVKDIEGQFIGLGYGIVYLNSYRGVLNDIGSFVQIENKEIEAEQVVDEV